MEKKWYVELFENYANKYEQESFTKGTITEVDFLEQELGFDKTKRILDIGCGTGRHTIELAKRGYSVCGIDLSEQMLDKARENSKEAKVNVDFIQADARTFSFPAEFDLAIMLCEGGFSLMETDMMNFQILKNAAEALKSGGKFIFTCLNALFPLHNSIDQFVSDGTSGIQVSNFNLLLFRDYSTYTLTGDDGREMALNCNERYYVPSELHFMLELLGF
jgi:SAM-dependent methyltransferase